MTVISSIFRQYHLLCPVRRICLQHGSSQITPAPSYTNRYPASTPLDCGTGVQPKTMAGTQIPLVAAVTRLLCRDSSNQLRIVRSWRLTELQSSLQRLCRVPKTHPRRTRQFGYYRLASPPHRIPRKSVLANSYFAYTHNSVFAGSMFSRWRPAERKPTIHDVFSGIQHRLHATATRQIHCFLYLVLPNLMSYYAVLAGVAATVCAPPKILNHCLYRASFTEANTFLK